MGESTIEWTERTWNPIVGCSVHSAGCRGCYAMPFAWRMMHHPHPKVAAKFAGTAAMVNGHAVFTGRVNLDEEALLAPLRRRKATTWFVNSLSDLFHENVPDETRDRIFAVMALCPQHRFQVLTKRSERMRGYLTHPARPGRIARAILDLAIDDPKLLAREPWPVASVGDIDEPDDVTLRRWPLPNVWLGVSVEDQAAADARIPDLLATPAAVRFLSCEPLLGAVDLTSIDIDGDSEIDALNPINLSDEWREWCEGEPDAPADEQLEGFVEQYGRPPDGKPLHPVIDWVICGGESGRRARPMHPDWARSLRDPCAAAGVPFFFKQWGEWAIEPGVFNETCVSLLTHFGSGSPPVSFASVSAAWPDGHVGPGSEGEHGGLGISLKRVGKKAAGRLLDGVEHSGMPA